jgi:cobalt/nickel transport system permease protein
VTLPRSTLPRQRSVLCAALPLLLPCTLAASALAQEPPARWSGIDESVIEKVAAEAGRSPRPLWFEMEGDLGLFLFLCAGIAGGSVFGYCFRMLFVERIDERPSHARSRVA